MIENFKEWLNSILVLGVLFMLVKLILPNTKIKKYVYSVMGIITILVIISPVINTLNKNSSDEALSKIVLDLADRKVVNMDYMNFENMEENTVNTIKEKFKENLSEDIKNKIRNECGIESIVEVIVTKSYNIEEIIVNIDKEVSYDIVSYISGYYDISKDKIKVNVRG